jgi:hypothetical protein
MRKVKFTQDSFDEKLDAILTEFPVLDVRRPVLSMIFLRLDINFCRICTRSYRH